MKLAEPEFVAIPAEPVDEAVPPRRERTGLATARRRRFSRILEDGAAALDAIEEALR